MIATANVNQFALCVNRLKKNLKNVNLVIEPTKVQSKTEIGRLFEYSIV